VCGCVGVGVWGCVCVCVCVCGCGSGSGSGSAYDLPCMYWTEGPEDLFIQATHTHGFHLMAGLLPLVYMQSSAELP
jgi:hypothetical protein